MQLASREFRNIALMGFMGTGKTTVGHLLSDLLQFELIDTDRVIELRTGHRIAEIFAAEHGEATFRKIESEVVRELESATNKVISTGGGTVVNPENLASLKKHSLLACLWASPETVFERVRHQQHRPLLNMPNPLATIRKLMLERAPCYREADIIVGVDFRHATEVARNVAKSFRDVTRRR
ncbi:MAG: shikimate kinase [Pedosphaera sp.]|nr:shikimate kinase [Pedosphaera sp.]